MLPGFYRVSSAPGITTGWAVVGKTQRKLLGGQGGRGWLFFLLLVSSLVCVCVCVFCFFRNSRRYVGRGLAVAMGRPRANKTQ